MAEANQEIAPSSDEASARLSRVRQKDTAPETRIRRELYARGLRYRVQYTVLSKPRRVADIAFIGPKVAVFVDGCFWHGCPLHYVRPRSREEFWADKLRANVQRDRRQTLEGEREGWVVCRIWEHDVFERLDQAVETVQRAIREGSGRRSPEWRVVSVTPVAGAEALEERALEDLRSASRRKSTVQPRSTRKWKRVSG